MERKRRILVVARWPVGGIRTYFRYIYSQPHFESYEITFITPNADNLEQFLREFLAFDIKYIDCGNSTRQMLLAAKRELKLGSYDLLHSHGYTAGIAMAPLQVLYPKVPHLMTAHDVFQHSQFDGIKGRFKRLLTSIAFRAIPYIHVVSKDCKDNFLEFFPSVNEKKITTILHGIDTERFYSGQALDYRKQMPELKGAYLFGFFGRFMSQKGFRYIVTSIKQLIESGEVSVDQIRVLTYGWGGFVREEFESIEKLGLSDVFIQMPHTDDMPAALKGMDCVVMPSLWEACGLLGMEVLVAGVPIIGANCIGLREVLEGSPATIVPPRDAHALAEAIKHEMSRSRRAEFAEYAKQAKQRFSLEQPAAQLEQLYQSILRANSQRFV